jgi:hypothetical protein
MNLPKVLRPSSLRFFLLAASQGVLVSSALAQYGAAPSQTGMFFDDLRMRQVQERAATQSGTRDGDVTYDYDSGVYRDGSNDKMGQRSADYESARELSRPAVRSGSSAYAARSVGDYTNYSGQYTSPTGFFAPTYTSDPFLNGRRNLKLGPINVGFGFFQGLEYNDNVNRSGTDPQSDVISTTLLNIDANYQITQNNRLSLSTAIGFDRYWENPENASYGGTNGLVLNVLPGSTVAFDIKAGPVFFTVYNRFSVRPAARNDFALSQNQMFGVFQNDTGIAANWRINSDWALAVNYMHSFTDSLSEANQGIQGGFDEFNRVTDSLQASLTYSPSSTWVLGFEGGITAVDYETDFNADGVLNNIGAFFVLPIGKTTYLRASAGYQGFKFDNFPEALEIYPDPLVRSGGSPNLSPNQIVENTNDNSDLSDFYYSITLSNRLNSRISQSLSLGHESSLNLTSNYITADFINYGVSMVAWKGSRVNLSAYYEDAEASGGFFAQDVKQYGLDFYISHRLSSRLQLGTGYHYGKTTSISRSSSITPIAQRNIEGEFVQQAFNVDLTYVLSPKATLNFGYRYYTTDVKEDNDLDFDQNRLIIGVNYNF